MANRAEYRFSKIEEKPRQMTLAMEALQRENEELKQDLEHKKAEVKGKQRTRT